MLETLKMVLLKWQVELIVIVEGMIWPLNSHKTIAHSDKDDNIHKSEGLKSEAKKGKTNNNSYRVSKLNKQNINL